jgi:hypothetical protein
VNLIPLGWREWVALPELGVSRIKAKVDTGARTSALHAFQLATYEKAGHTWVKFQLHPLQGDTEAVVECHAPVKDHRKVRDSGGHEEYRYVIESTIQVGEKKLTAELTLTERDTMRFRMLLGRTALKGRYIVDPGASYLSTLSEPEET